ncbi:MAG TPA: SDR family NAD(P)-dependent oxidoreductase [Bauldia sp.]|nr:SDR family NAD(P)-dependent oxidoreductase [Bauldia sp.]
MRGLKGKVAAVTGAGSGIGQAAARRLAAEGCKVAVIDWKAEAAAATVAEIEKGGGEAIAITADVGKEADVEAAFRKVVEAFGRLDILVSNAGVFSAERDGRVETLPKAVWDEMISSNLTGMYLSCKHGVAAMRATAKTGAVVITGSPTGMLGVTPASIAYSSSKGGVHGLARVMAVDYAQEGIRVNVVVPGFTLSPLVRELVADPKVYEWNVKNIPMRRGAEPDEIAGAVAFLASDDASYMTGSFVVVDGGLTAV